MKTLQNNVMIQILCIAVSASLLLDQRYVDALSISRWHNRRPFFPKHITPLPHTADGAAEHLEEEPHTSAQPVRRAQRGKRKPRGFRRGKQRDFQLNFKDTDDITDVQEKKRLMRVLSKIRLRSLRRKKLASEKAAVAVVQEGSTPAGEEVLMENIDVDGHVSASADDSKELSVVSALDTTKTKKRPAIRKKKPLVVVSTIHELREAILDKGIELRDVELNYSPPPSLRSSNSTIFQHYNENFSLESSHENVTQSLFTHDVLNLLHQRYHSHSTPANRSIYDNATLALAIEGGGMRGAVSGGMAAAIVCLGLSNAFDAIYGSSAGSIIGSYFVSRQLYLDVYTDVIPAGFDLFVSKAKIIGDMFRNMFLVMKGNSWRRLNGLLLERFKIPKGEEPASTLQPTREGGLNISFVLDSIMCPERGLRPLDLESFAHNDEVQPLRIVSSAVCMETGKLKSIVFGSKDGHFCDGFANPVNGNNASYAALYPEILSAEADEQGYRRGLWACLGASMSVPGAAGSPFPMDLPSNDGKSRHLCFDAFCYEPVPYRSAVAEGATHVLALRSKPAAAEPKTKPTLYERAVAPLYFRSHKAESVAKFFEQGGQQYLYAEDVLTCDEGLDARGTIPIPPTEVLYGNPEVKSSRAKDRSQWKRAHLLPIIVPADVPELGTLEDDRDLIISGIRSGFAAVSSCTNNVSPVLATLTTNFLP